MIFKQTHDIPDGYNGWRSRIWCHGDAFRGTHLRLYEKDDKRQWNASCGNLAYMDGMTHDCKTHIKRHIAKLQAMVDTIEEFETRLEAGKKLPKRWKACESLPGDTDDSPSPR